MDETGEREMRREVLAKGGLCEPWDGVTYPADGRGIVRVSTRGYTGNYRVRLKVRWGTVLAYLLAIGTGHIVARVTGCNAVQEACVVVLAVCVVRGYVT